MANGNDGGEVCVPLLETKPAAHHVYFDGCPGCAMDRRKAENTGIPYALFFHMWIINLVICLPISSLFPFVYFMVRDLHIAKRVEDIGFYVGFVGASYMLGRTLTSIIWGMLADHIGRKPVIVILTFSMLVFNTLFGLSGHYWMAIATRFLLGFLNGSLGTMRAYAVEVCRSEHHALGISLVSASWATALIIGPAIGGYLAQPTKNFPKLFPANSLFGRFPYFLPCLCISVAGFVILISCVWLPTVRPTLVIRSPTSTTRSNQSTLNQETLHMHKHNKEEDQTTRSLVAHVSDYEEPIKQYGILATKKSLFTNWPLMSSIILYCITCFEETAYSEVFSLWAESDKKYGGLSFSTVDVGNILVVTGAIFLLFQAFIYPQIIKYFRLVNASRVAAILSMVLLFIHPSMTNLSRPWLFVVVNIASVLKSCFVATVVTSSLIFQNDSVTQDQRETANGIANTLMSFLKTLAPIGAGSVFSWAQKHQHTFIFSGDQMIFFLLALIVFLEFSWTFKPFLAMPTKQSSSS